MVFFNFFYQRIYFWMMRLTSWDRVFNSEYSRIKFNLRFGTLYSHSAVVPVLGLVDLFPQRQRDLVRAKAVSEPGALWIGSKHSFKGGEVFARIVKKLTLARRWYLAASCRPGRILSMNFVKSREI